MIFVDTSAWFASVVSDDVDHVAAGRAFATSHEPFVTTDYVLDELLTLLTVRGRRELALVIGDGIIRQVRTRLEYVSPEDVQQAWSLFNRFADKEWSFTDCTSYVVMRRLGITTALSCDHHFRQFGSVTVVP